MKSDISWKVNTLIALFGLLLLSFFVNLVKNFELSDDNLYLYHSISTVVLKDAKSIEKQNYILDESLKLETMETRNMKDREES